MKIACLYLREGMVYIHSDIENSLGASSPKGPIKSLGRLAGLTAIAIGVEAIAAMLVFDGQVEDMDTIEPNRIDKAAKLLGFKSEADFLRNTRLVVCDEVDGFIHVYPSKRYRQRSGAFAFLKELIPSSDTPEALGSTIAEAFERYR